MLVGVFRVPSEFNTAALTVNGGGLFLHGSNVKINPDYLRGRGRSTEALPSSGLPDIRYATTVSQQGKDTPFSVLTANTLGHVSLINKGNKKETRADTWSGR
jgi:hypothetical protein